MSRPGHVIKRQYGAACQEIQNMTDWQINNYAESSLSTIELSLISVFSKISFGDFEEADML